MATTTPSGEQAWPLGEALKTARQRMHLGIAKAAERAGMSQGQWHMIERGRRAVAGGHKPYTPAAVHVIAAARAVAVDPRRALELAGYVPNDFAAELADPGSITSGELLQKIGQLTAGQRAAVLATIDSMLEPARPPEPGQRHGILYEGEIDEDVPVEQSAEQRSASTNSA